MPKIRVLLADDHAILREGLTMLINGHPEMEVIAQAATASEAVRLAQASRPDVAVLDISMPEGGGATAAEPHASVGRGHRVTLSHRFVSAGSPDGRWRVPGGS